MAIWFELGIILALTLLNGVFAGAEIAILSIRKTRLRELVDVGSGSARAAARLRGDPERFLATVQIGVTVISATSAAVGGATLEAPIARALGRVGLRAHADDLALALVVVLVSYLSLVLGELVPKSLALRSSERFTLLVSRALLALSWLARPLVWFLTLSSNCVLKAFGDHTTFTEARLSPEELQQLVEEAATVGTLDPRTGDIASRALEFGTLRIAAVMVQRTAITTVRHDASPADVRLLLRTHPHSRFPVRDDTDDSISGYVTARDLFGLLDEDKPLDIRALRREAPFFSEGTLAIDVLKELQRLRSPLGMIVNEQGSVEGIVTIEDITEELVGEILAEHEVPVERIRRLDDGSAFVLGNTPVHEINRELGLDLPVGPGWTTLAGLVMATAERIPQPGDRIELAGGVGAEVVDGTARYIIRLRLHLPGKREELAL